MEIPIIRCREDTGKAWVDFEVKAGADPSVYTWHDDVLWKIINTKPPVKTITEDDLTLF